MQRSPDSKPGWLTPVSVATAFHEGREKLTQCSTLRPSAVPRPARKGTQLLLQGTLCWTEMQAGEPSERRALTMASSLSWPATGLSWLPKFLL